MKYVIVKYAQGNVWRRGNAAEKVIKEGLKKGDLYQTFYDYWNNVVNKS